MNDNRKSVLEQALDAVRTTQDGEDLADGELRELLNEFKARLAAQEAANGTTAH